MNSQELATAGLVVTKNSKQPELQAAFSKEIETGAPFIYSLVDSDKPGFRVAYLAQRIQSPTSNSQRQHFLSLGQGPLQRIARANWTVRTDRMDEIAKTLGAPLSVGMVLGGTKLVCEQATKPFYEGQSPKLYGANSTFEGQPMTHGGAPIFEDFYLGLPEFTDTLLEVDTPVVQAIED